MKLKILLCLCSVFFTVNTLFAHDDKFIKDTQNALISEQVKFSSPLSDFKVGEYTLKDHVAGWKSQSPAVASKTFPAKERHENDDEVKIYNVLTLLSMIAPKSSVAMRVYRGAKCRNSNHKTTVAYSTWSTSFDYGIAKSFSKTNNSKCVLEFTIPAGMPLFYINTIENKHKIHEKEVVLPQFVLDSTGKKLRRNVFSFQSERIEEQGDFQVQSLKSIDRMQYEGEEDFSLYQKNYKEKVCSLVKNVSYLREICEHSNFEYNSSLQPCTTEMAETAQNKKECDSHDPNFESCIQQYTESICKRNGFIWAGFKCLKSLEVEGIVQEKEVLPNDIIKLKVHPTRDLEFKAGQFTFIKNKANEARAYAFSNSYEDYKKSKTLEFIIKIFPSSFDFESEDFTSYFRDVEVGETIHFDKKAHGNFTYKKEGKRNLFVISDNGFAPIFSMLDSIPIQNTHEYLLLDTSGSLNDDTFIFKDKYELWKERHNLKLLEWRWYQSLSKLVYMQKLYFSIALDFKPTEFDEIYYCGGIYGYNQIKTELDKKSIGHILHSCR